MKIKPRCYQLEIVDTLWQYLFDYTGNPLVVSPTGTGKSLALNMFCKQAIKEFPGTRVMVLTHNKDIIGQNANSMFKFWPTAPIGIYSAGLRQRDTDYPLTYAGIQSIYKRPEEFGEVNIIIIDEAHMLSPNDGTMYKTFIDYMTKVNPNLRVIGFSATPYRLGQGLLTEEDGLFDDIIIDFTETQKFNWFVDEGFLSPLVTKRTRSEIDYTKARVLGGEFNPKDIGELANTNELNRAVVEECIEYGADRRHWMVFAANVEHGKALQEVFEARGVSAIFIDAKTEGRDDKRKAWEESEYRCLINVGLYTTGYDFPALDLLAIVKSTQSTAWWVQVCGRGTRCVYYSYEYPQTKDERLLAIAEGPKQDCLVLDFGGNTRRLGPINAPIIPKPRRKGDKEDETEAPVKTCPTCQTYNHTRASHCVICGYEFPPPESLNASASDDDIMVKDAQEPNVVEIDVLSVTYRKKISKNGRVYLRCTYSTIGKRYHDTVFIGSDEPVLRNRADKWWWHRVKDRKGLNQKTYDYPKDIYEATERTGELKVPQLIRVDINKEYPDVLGADFMTKAESELYDEEAGDRSCECGVTNNPPCSYCEDGGFCEKHHCMRNACMCEPD